MFNFTVDKDCPIPYYYQIEEWIRGMIAKGQLKAGDMLPSEVSLVEQLGVSRMTVRQALNHLTSEGILTRRRAIGTFVAQPRQQVPFVRDRLRSVTEEVTGEGKRLFSKVLAQELTPASGELMHALKLDPADKVVLIRRLRSIEAGPLSIESAYHPYQRFPDLLTTNLANRSIYEILDQRYHARPTEAEDTLVVGVANKEEAQLLEVKEGDPLLRYQRIAKDSSGKPIEYTQAVYRADRYQIVIHYQKVENSDP